jgi:hypothetical protein
MPFLYLAANAIEIEKAGAGLIQISPAVPGTRLPQPAQTIDYSAGSTHREKR